MTERECDELLGLSSVGLSQEVCRRSPVCLYTTDSRALVQGAVAWLSWLSVRLFTSKSGVVPPLESTAQGFRWQPTVVLLCSKHVHSCAILLVGIA